MEPRFILGRRILQDLRNSICNALSGSKYVDLSTRNIQDSHPDDRLEGNH